MERRRIVFTAAIAGIALSLGWSQPALGADFLEGDVRLARLVTIERSFYSLARRLRSAGVWGVAGEPTGVTAMPDSRFV